MTITLVHSFLLLQLLLLAAGPCGRMLIQAAGGGRWELLKPSIGIAALHMQLLNNDRVVMFDRTDFGLSNISLPNGKCRNDPQEAAVTTDCTAHSVEYDVAANAIRPLMVLTDVWCSSGALMPDGRLVQTGGYNDGDHVVRTFRPCAACDWEETQSVLTHRRWYATNHILPDGRQIIVGGRKQFNYEFYPKTESNAGAYSLPFLAQTNEPGMENNLYPFVFLNVDGNLFIFANNRAILLDYSKNVVLKTYPELPGGDPRSYPSTGSSVLLPLKLHGPKIEAEVLVCGGAPKGSFTSVQKGVFVKALNTCGRLKLTDPSPKWAMETMPLPRVMGDMILLPNRHVLIINGASSGAAGWENGRDPVVNPVLYRPGQPTGSRFSVQNPTTIPRMYHSSAILLRDGRILVGGSNPHINYNFTTALFPTELRLEAFSPSYLDPQFANLCPKIISPHSQIKVGYGQKFSIQFTLTTDKLNESLVRVTMVAPSFSTHSFSMNQRLLVLSSKGMTPVGKSTYQVEVMTPGSGNLAPSGFYMMYVVHQDFPSKGIWVQIQ